MEAREASVGIDSAPGGAVVVRLCGDHDLSTKPRLIDALVAVRRASAVVIDLTECTFVDSTIIAAIMNATRASSAKGPSVSLRLPSDTSYVYRALAVAGLRDLLPAYHSVAADGQGRREPESRADACRASPSVTDITLPR
jgi:anti-anti-sigma factor